MNDEKPPHGRLFICIKFYEFGLTRAIFVKIEGKDFLVSVYKVGSPSYNV